MRETQMGVVIPTLNSAKTLEWTLLSLQKQEGCNLQIIVADSGSTDGTLEICEQRQVKTIYVPPGNMYRAINAGMRELGTPWLTYLNSDDIVYSDAYSRLIATGESDGADLVYGVCTFIDAEGHYSYTEKAAPLSMLPRLFRSGIFGFAQPAAIFRQEVYCTLGGFCEDYRLVADFDFFARAFRAGKSYSRLSAPPVAAFRIHSGQLSGARHEVFDEWHRVWQTPGFRRDAVTYTFWQLWRLFNISALLYYFTSRPTDTQPGEWAGLAWLRRLFRESVGYLKR